MNIRCPYCGCCYEIDYNVLGAPIGNEKLGYGWWLRCYRCHKKWWLKNSYVEERLNAPLKANKEAKIGRLRSLISKNRRGATGNQSQNILKYIIWGITILIAVSCYFLKDNFTQYINTKAITLQKNIANKLTLTNVQYNIVNNNMTVTGVIVNKDTKNIMNANGIKVNILRDKKIIDSWTSEFDGGTILPQQQIPFNSSKQLDCSVDNITVEVLIF